MPTKNPRINVVLEPRLHQMLITMATNDGVSLSMKVRDLLKEAMEFYEDAFLADFADLRDKTIKDSKMLSHEEVWG